MAKNRGRFQAQGGGVEESIAWDQDAPPTASEAHSMLEELEGRLSKKEARMRKEAFGKAYELIDRAAVNGGQEAPLSQSWPQPPLRGGARVDVEVITGIAFVPDPDED